MKVSSNIRKNRMIQKKTKAEYLEILKQIPRVSEFVTKVKDDEELLSTYCYNLLKDTRNGKRKGFPLDVSEALMYFSKGYEGPATVWDFN